MSRRVWGGRFGSGDTRALAGKHTTEQAPGAWPNGTRVSKDCSLPGDGHDDGAQATVIGSVGAPGMHGYYVEWDDRPGVACFIAGTRLLLAGGDR